MTDKNQSDRLSNNIGIVRQVYTLFDKRDIDTILKLLSTDIEWVEPSNPFNPAGGTRHGQAGFLEWLNIGRQSEQILVLIPQKFLADNDSVAVVGYTKCLAKPTGKIYETDFIHLFTFKEGKIIRFQEFFDTYIAGEAFRQD
jgi:ketosteroid isomerase-like protein